MDEQKIIETHETTTHTITEPVVEHTPAVPVVVAQEQKDRILPISIIVAAFMVAGAIIFATVYKGGGVPAPIVAGNETSTAPAQNAAPTTASITAALSLGSRDAILGSASAPVTLIEYGDYQCPFCAQYFQKVEPSVLQNYINPGKVKMIFRNFAFLGPESIAAAEAAECAEDQNKLWPYHDALYTAKLADFTKGGSEDDGILNRALFVSIAQRLSMDIPTFTNCIDTNKYASLIDQEKTAAGAAGVNSTPTTFINKVMVTDANGASVGADATTILQDLANATAGK